MLALFITGGTSGVDYQCALAIARKHPSYQITIASRTDNGFCNHHQQLPRPKKDTTFHPLDLGSISNIRAFATHFSSSDRPPISHLVLNAVLQFTDGEIHKTADGFETTFGISHIGHSLLFHLLFPYFAKEARSRIGNYERDARPRSEKPDANFTKAEKVVRPNAKKAGEGERSYTTTKLCNVIWTYALAKRFSNLSQESGGRKLTAMTFNPDLMPGTGLARASSVIGNSCGIR